MTTNNRTVNTNFLALSWSVSRGQDTYGYNIARLDDQNTGSRCRTIGGGYDMVGTVIGEWLENVYQDRLQALCDTLEAKPYGSTSWVHFERYYGMQRKPDGSVRLDGACGQSSMQTLARAIGVSLSATWNKKGHTTGFMVTEYQDRAHMQELLGELAD